MDWDISVCFDQFRLLSDALWTLNGSYIISVLAKLTNEEKYLPCSSSSIYFCWLRGRLHVEGFSWGITVKRFRKRKRRKALVFRVLLRFQLLLLTVWWFCYHFNLQNLRRISSSNWKGKWIDVFLFVLVVFFSLPRAILNMNEGYMFSVF